MRLLKMLLIEYVMRVAVVSAIFVMAVWCTGCSTVSSRADDMQRTYDSQIAGLQNKTRYEAVRTLGMPTKVWKAEEGGEWAQWEYSQNLGTSYNMISMPVPFNPGMTMSNMQAEDNGTLWCKTLLHVNMLGFIDSYKWQGNHCIVPSRS